LFENILITRTGFEFVLFGALGLLPTYALAQGFSSQTSFNIIAILNAYVCINLKSHFTNNSIADPRLDAHFLAGFRTVSEDLTP